MRTCSDCVCEVALDASFCPHFGKRNPGRGGTAVVLEKFVAVVVLLLMRANS